MNVAEEIRRRLAALHPSRLDLTDESAQHAGHAGARPGGNTHWRLRMTSPEFAGKATVVRHRMVYHALGNLMDNPIHALAITARAPGEPGA